MNAALLTKARAVWCVVCGLAVPAISQAQGVLSYSADVPSFPPDWSVPLAIPKFDQTLGTLTDVTVFYHADVTQVVLGENKSCASATYDFSDAVTISMTMLGGAMVFPATTFMLQQTGVVGAFDGTIDFKGRSGVEVSQTTHLGGAYDDANLAAYIGAGMLYFNANEEVTSALLLSGCDGLTRVSGVAYAGLTVQYTYAAIPEPAAGSALIGLLALGFVWCRRRIPEV